MSDLEPLWDDVSYRTVEAWMLLGGIGGCPDCGVRAEFTDDEKNRIDAWLMLFEAKIRADQDRKTRADVWDEGFTACDDWWEASHDGRHPVPANPYRKRR